ncbi:MAG TPA: transcription antitermination factor NusB [Thermoleophilaceae bacterium]|nr:transcription antitermination factor NusB [Thermoleophilaceae bacterium]
MKRTDQRRAAVVALYQRDVTGRPLDQLLDRETKGFSRELAEGVAAEQAELDAIIEQHAVGWTLDRIAPLERNILRVALYELLRREDVPAEVAIDEAVEAAKELCGADAPGFINGILGAAVRDGSAVPK